MKTIKQIQELQKNDIVYLIDFDKIIKTKITDIYLEPRFNGPDKTMYLTKYTQRELKYPKIKTSRGGVSLERIYLTKESAKKELINRLIKSVNKNIKIINKILTK